MKKPDEIKKVKDDPTCFECNHYEVCMKWSNAGYLHRDNPKKCSDFTGRSAERIRISALEIVVDDQDKAIQQLEAQVPRWISVEEREPEWPCYVYDGIMPYIPEVGIVMVELSPGDKLWIPDLPIECVLTRRLPKTFKRPITHWMPLPEPPKED